MYNFDALKYRIKVPEAEVLEIAKVLNTPRPGIPNGSSYAVTSDADRGYRYMYMSEASFQTLSKLHVIPDVHQPEQTEQPES
jgi:hypothetical protein